MQTIKINGKDYYTVKDFAALIGKNEQTVRKYIKVGNKIRRLECIKVGWSVFIPVEELTDYPFTSCGNNSQAVYHYDLDGVIAYEDII